MAGKKASIAAAATAPKKAMKAANAATAMKAKMAMKAAPAAVAMKAKKAMKAAPKKKPAKAMTQQREFAAAFAYENCNTELQRELDFWQNH